MKNPQIKYSEKESKIERLRKAIIFGFCSFLLDSIDTFTTEEVVEALEQITENYKKEIEKSRKIK